MTTRLEPKRRHVVPVFARVPSLRPSGAWESGEATTKAAENYPTILAHDQSQVNLETQVSEMVKNRLQHNMAVSILSNQMQLLRAAISEQA